MYSCLKVTSRYLGRTQIPAFLRREHTRYGAAVLADDVNTQIPLNCRDGLMIAVAPVGSQTVFLLPSGSANTRIGPPPEELVADRGRVAS